jgi:hypothetical protein
METINGIKWGYAVRVSVRYGTKRVIPKDGIP